MSAASLQKTAGTIDCILFYDAAEVELHSRLQKAKPRLLPLNFFPPHSRQKLSKLTHVGELGLSFGLKVPCAAQQARGDIK